MKLSTPLQMMPPSCHVASTTLPVKTRTDHRVSDLPASLPTYHARRQLGIMAASQRESSKQYYTLAPAFQSCLEWRATDSATCTLDHGTADPTRTARALTKYDDHHKTTSVQQMHHNIHRKRGAWQQMAIRNRLEANHRQENLQILQDAAQRAKAATYVDRNVRCETSDMFRPPQACKIFVAEANTSGSSASLSLDHKKLDANTAAVRIQAHYRGLKTRCSRPGSLEQGTIEPLKDQDILKMCLHAVAHIQQPRLERQVSNITTSDLDDDSSHHTFSVSKTVSTQESLYSPRNHSRWNTLATQMDNSSSDIRMMTAKDHGSVNKFFGHPLRVCGLNQTDSGSQSLDDFMLDGDSDDDDDDVSLAGSFFEEESRVDTVLLKRNNLNRSEGALDVNSMLQRAAPFHNLTGTISTSCFHLSLSSTSRWDDGLPHPASISHLHPKDQLAISKAAFSTCLPVRQPPRALSPHNIVATTSNMNSGRTNNSPRSTIFSSRESTEPSPTMPLRKASSHGTAHLTFQGKNRERSSYKSSIPVPPLTCQDECRRSSRATFSESSSLQLPIRKNSSHNSMNQCPQGLRTLHSVLASSTCISATAIASTLEDGPIRQPQ